MSEELYPTFDIDEEMEQEIEGGQAVYKIEPKFDFELGDFIMDDTGRLVMADEITTWMQWCITTAITVRDAHPAYSDEIGVEMEQIVGISDHDKVEEIISETLEDALLADPSGRTESVEDINFTWKGDKIYVTANVVSVEGDEEELALGYKIY